MADNDQAGGQQAAPAPAALPPLPAFKPGVMYRVQLKAPMMMGQTQFSPMHPCQLEGEFAESVKDNIASAEEA